MDFSQIAAQALAQTTPQQNPLDIAGDKILGAIELGGTGVALAYLNARSPAEGKNYHESFGYPTDGIVAVAGLLMGLLFNSPHALRIGIGAGVEFGVRYGFAQGITDKKKAKLLETKKADLRIVEGKKNDSLVQASPEEAFAK